MVQISKPEPSRPEMVMIQMTGDFTSVAMRNTLVKKLGKISELTQYKKSNMITSSRIIYLSQKRDLGRD